MELRVMLQLYLCSVKDAALFALTPIPYPAGIGDGGEGKPEENGMRPILRRIAIHGGITAIILGIIGLMMAELASIWIVVAVPGKAAAKGNPVDLSVLRQRLPLFMGVAGFAFVAVGELLLHRIRKNRLPPAPQTPAQADQTEKLLQELLAKEEAKMAASQQGIAPPTSQESIATNTPPNPPTP
jgi:hypothetical protein